MSDEAGVDDGYRLSSPWPLFVAVGLAASEVGVVIGIIPVAVGGLLLFVWSVAGIVEEAGYVDTPWGLLGALGLVLVVLGGIVIAGQATTLTVDGVRTLLAGALGDQPNGVVIRGLSIVAAGAIAFGASRAAAFAERDDPAEAA
jgi:hypothetical protein